MSNEMQSQFIIAYEGEGRKYPEQLDTDYYNKSMAEAIPKAYQHIEENESITCAKIIHNNNLLKHFYRITHKDSVITVKFELISELEK
jgi:translation elongation factor EF-Ts